MKHVDLKSRWALVTGASSGLGVDFAKNLAGRGCNLILVARRADRLEAVQQEIVTQYGVQVDVIAMDLEPADAPQELYDQIKAAGRAIDVLINNAGFGLYGEFLEIPWERERAMLELDIVTLTYLTKLFAGDMVERRFGYILLVSSIGAYQPSPTYATYSAAKTYVLYFGEVLHYELRTTGVNVTVVSPGVTRTEFLEVAGQQCGHKIAKSACPHQVVSDGAPHRWTIHRLCHDGGLLIVVISNLSCCRVRRFCLVTASLFAFIQALVEKRQKRIDVTEAASLITPVIVQTETKYVRSVCRAIIAPHRQQEDAIVGWHVFDRVYRGCMTCNRAALRHFLPGRIPATGFQRRLALAREPCYLPDDAR